MTTLGHSALDELRFRLRGGVHEPGDPEYADTCTLFNAMIERRPALVAHCRAPQDVIAALAYARAEGLEIAVRAGGHSVAGHSLNDGGMVLDVRGLDDIAVDPVGRVARVGAGCTWAQLDRATQEYGLATTGGRVSSTGVAGLTLGGGSGWLERKHGLTCDNVLAFELVTAEGRMVRATADEHPDLFWAMRGGGGNFGVVTAIEYRLHEVGPLVMAGLVLHPAERRRELLALYRDVMRDAPEGLSLAFMDFTAPEDDDDIPAELRGQRTVLVAGMYAGAIAEGEHALREIREFGPPTADFFAPTPYAEFQQSLDDPPGYRNYWTAQHLRDMPDAAIDTISARSAQLPVGGAQLFICAWGGAVARVGPEETPLAGRDATFVVHPLFLWEDPADDELMIAHARGYRDDMEPYATGATYLNFIGDEGDERLRAGFGDRNHERLARVKAEWDPQNVFSGNQNVRPRTD
jgi:FAD/FMN-containing dehydrogenase